MAQIKLNGLAEVMRVTRLARLLAPRSRERRTEAASDAKAAARSEKVAAK